MRLSKKLKMQKLKSNYKSQKPKIMQSLEFNLENIREIELFTGTKLESYFQIGIPVGRFVFPKKEGEEKIEFELKQ
ncbi:hypothetical protein NL336_27120, partial [Klebsiella pneumoniae]|nr:hypothetical protein [Klebsiella pneumoniae]